MKNKILSKNIIFFNFRSKLVFAALGENLLDPFLSIQLLLDVVAVVVVVDDGVVVVVVVSATAIAAVVVVVSAVKSGAVIAYRPTSRRQTTHRL